tara:strand:+ start:2546 stop:2794 length:249 start_codon:yes stop_codon:yes gene_type:complete
MSVARNDYQQVRAAQEQMDAERKDGIAQLMDTVLYTNGAFSYHDLLKMEPLEIEILVNKFTEKVEKETAVTQQRAGKKSVKL